MKRALSVIIVATCLASAMACSSESPAPADTGTGDAGADIVADASVSQDTVAVADTAQVEPTDVSDVSASPDAAPDTGKADDVVDTSPSPDVAMDSDEGAEVDAADPVDTTVADAQADAAVIQDAASDAGGSPDVVSSDAAGSDVGGADAGGGFGYGGAPISLEKLADTYLEAGCKALFACKVAGGAKPTAEYNSVSGCAAIQAGEGGGQKYAQLVAATKVGTVLYDAAAAGTCLAAWTATCVTWQAAKMPAVCDGMFKGTVALGAACKLNGACLSGYCQLPESACPGVCKTPGQVGVSCALSAACAPGLVCFGGKCVADKPAKQGAPCGFGLPCADGLWCAMAAGKGTCLPLASKGGPCLNSTGCAAGLTCVVVNAGKPGTCATPGAVGAACSYKAFPDPTACVAGAVCIPDGNAGKCAAKGTAGQACFTTKQCVGLDAICVGAKDGKAGTCAPLPGAGDACTPPDFKTGMIYACLPPAICVASKCTLLPGDGQKCLQGLEMPGCAKGLVCGANKVCGPPPGEGKPCTTLCQPGLTCKFNGKSGVCTKPLCI